MSCPGIGVSLTGHYLTLDETCRLARLADDAGFEALLVDGDETAVQRRPAAPLYDAGVLAAAALSATQSLRVGSIRLPSISPAALVARSLATLQRLGGGRALGFFGVGSGRHEQVLGLARRSASERVQALDETLEAVRALLEGEAVTFHGRFVDLEGARAPRSTPRVPLVVAAAGPRALEVVARHADVWDANVPPLLERLEPLREQLPSRIETWIWVFARPGLDCAEAIREYRRVCPWFRELSDRECERAVLFGDAGEWPDRLNQLRSTLGVDLPILDLAGLDEAAAASALQAFAPAKAAGIA